MDKLTQQAVADALHFLSSFELRALIQRGSLSGDQSDGNLFGHPVGVTRIRMARQSCPRPSTVEVGDVLDRALSVLVEGHAERFFIEEDTLHLLLAPPLCTDAYLIAIPPGAIARFLAVSFPDKRITAAQQRLLSVLICGITLADSSVRNGRSAETQKSHARDLRGHFNAATTGDVVRMISAHLVAAVADMLESWDATSHEVFFDYCDRFLPRSVRPLVLSGPDGSACRVIDLGPLDGHPVIALHAIILPDLRDADVDLLHRLGLRLIWPLRPGQLAPLDPILPQKDMIEQSIAALDLVSRTFCQGRMTVLCFSASSKLALAYARKAPGTVERIIFAAACELDGRPQEGARRLARGMMALGEMDEVLQQAVVSILVHRAMQPDALPDFLRGQFAGCPADQAVLETELAPPRRGSRMHMALTNSLRSARHDFGFQRDLNWDGPPCPGTDLHFIHGSCDIIHPLPLIQRRVAELPGARLHQIPQAGQLLYGDHFAPMMRHVASLCGRQAAPA